MLTLEDIERRTMGVWSNLTLEGSRARHKQEFDAEVARILADDHAGGRARLDERCDQIGLHFTQLIESCAGELGRHNYDGDEGVIGESAVNAARDSAVGQRDCSWECLAARVEARIQETQKARGPVRDEDLITVSEAAIRHYCVARCVRSLVAKQHIGADGGAAVSARRLRSKSVGFHVDAHMSCAHVRLFEECFFALGVSLAEQGAPLLLAYRLWDDHAKWTADQKRGFDRHRAVVCTKENPTAPHTDMGGSVLGGGKLTTNSILVITPPGAYGSEAEESWELSSKRSMPCHKQAYAITRLECERRSTPTQQINDWRYLTHSDTRLSAITQKGSYVFSLADGGWDHQVRNTESQFGLTLDHLKSDRNADYNFARSATCFPTASTLARSIGRGACKDAAPLGRVCTSMCTAPFLA